MLKYLSQLIAMAICGFFSVSLSIRYGWSKKIWAVINRKLNPMYNATAWLLFAAALHLTLQWVLMSLAISNTRLITGIVIGIYFGFLPNLKKPGRNQK